MVCPDDQRFPKGSRLRRRGEYLAVQQAGRAVHSRAFVAVFAPNTLGRTRLGITTTRRIGGAVVRNRSRRQVREAFRRGEIRLPAGLDLIVIAKQRAAGLSGAAALADLQLLGQRVRAALGGAK